MEEKKCFGKYEEFHAACILCGASDDCKKYTEDGEESIVMKQKPEKKTIKNQEHD